MATTLSPWNLSLQLISHEEGAKMKSSNQCMKSARSFRLCVRRGQGVIRRKRDQSADDCPSMLTTQCCRRRQFPWKVKTKTMQMKI